MTFSSFFFKINQSINQSSTNVLYTAMSTNLPAKNLQPYRLNWRLINWLIEILPLQILLFIMIKRKTDTGVGFKKTKNSFSFNWDQNSSHRSGNKDGFVKKFARAVEFNLLNQSIMHNKALPCVVKRVYSKFLFCSWRCEQDVGIQTSLERKDTKSFSIIPKKNYSQEKTLKKYARTPKSQCHLHRWLVRREKKSPRDGSSCSHDIIPSQKNFSDGMMCAFGGAKLKTTQRKWGEMKQRLAWNSGEQRVS